ncbi:23S rRNA (adenine(1618)-N(6))-methyltransferase RlmF [Tenacibaculum piscium]|uniref:23S rRNA (adenine(1618)-N(6))-methyltransferase RlmF n=1 Tax=Tenacibaculum piscium TaxID=1458515 RepID=UPI00187B3099|nr:23S rRNA (adenine(1618)-N(6))-methyltransferase RlmF [Tenacibaculum piscium]MBE7685375.1 23S rRNA (adenine(1618)-N(6))-methyltransferase RlmF [Tenacibaculum piscium]MBE7690651.1 23S rRNA (adenine(1618)-N(6))-methyltransferase RlmF [Tenacibaculum piscium]MCG8182570.1 23S rRNA (adenine(1618)-N(6))-methyltransferase RlmF [Tenacibaculum piscium]MCG8203962.1 23S rRNA (adenine(1618)-N(6))-methyltransferase RlmF [Tenacibaculum piscium]
MEDKKGLHENNKHKNGYDFEFLKAKYPPISEFVIKKFEKETIDFSDPVAVKEFNKALLMAHYQIKDWNFPDENLCPPIPGRVDYIHHLADLIADKSVDKSVQESTEITVLDIGTGASCIYPLLGASAYNWNFVAVDIDLDSLDYAQDIIDDNQLDAKITLRQQFNESNVLKGITQEDDAFSVTMCNPPFYKSAEEARGANRRKSRNLGNNTVRNFAGNHNELWYIGGEKAFLHTYLYESSLQPKLSNWFTSLVSKKENVKSLQDSAKKLGVQEFKVIPMSQGNKVTRIVCWRF